MKNRSTLGFLLVVIILVMIRPDCRAGNPNGAYYHWSGSRLFWFMIISDSHIGTSGSQDTDYLTWAVTQAREIINPFFIVNSGDLTDSTNGGVIPNGPYQEEWDAYRQILVDAGMDETYYYDIPGNHDEYNDGDLIYYLSNSIQGSATGATQHSWMRVFPYGGYHFLGVCTAANDGKPFSIWPWNNYGDNAGLDVTELTFIETELANHPDSDLTLIFGHHPFDAGYYSSTDTGLTYGRDALLDLIDTYGVSSYEFGHTHNYRENFYYYGLSEGVFYLNVDSLGKSDENHLSIMAVDGNALSVIPVQKGTWPVVLITAPVDQNLGDTPQPFAYEIPQGRANPVRALIFDQYPVTSVQFRIDNDLTWRDMQKSTDSPSPSLRQLMNTEEFLFSTFYGTTWSVTTPGNENTWLKELNSGSGIYTTPADRMSNDGSGGKVHVGLFVGLLEGSDTFKTIEKIKCGSPRGLYDDGIPVYPKKRTLTLGLGDGTVPYDSAIWPANQGWSEYLGDAPVTHAELIKELVGEISNFLTEGYVSQSPIKSQADIETSSDVNATLSLLLNGSVRACLSDSSNAKTGIDPVTGDYMEQIPDSSAVFIQDGGSIEINNPSDGLYTVSIFGETQKDFDFGVSYSNSEQTSTKEYKGFCNGNSILVQISLNSIGDPHITITPPAQAPTGLIASPYSQGESTLTKLTWTPTGEGGVTNFNIYAVNETDPYFSKVASLDSGTTSFDTTDVWCENQNILLMTYAVTAEKSDGSESFFSDTAQNNDRDHDGLKDIDEIIMQTNMNDFDSDDDGLSDGEEYTLATNPLLADTDGDGYNDYDEINGDSDPLDETSVPLCKGDLNGDGDVDGSDLSDYISSSMTINIEDFVGNFGKNDCPILP